MSATGIGSQSPSLALPTARKAEADSGTGSGRPSLKRRAAPASGHHRRQCDDERRHPGPGGERPVQATDRRAARQGGKHSHGRAGLRQDGDRHHPGQGHHGADAQVDPPDQDHRGHAERQDGVERNLLR